MKNVKNIAEFSGRVHSLPVFDHNIYKEDFYSFFIEVERLSGVSDILPVTVSAKLLFGMDLEIGTAVDIRGQIRSYNKMVGERSRLDLRIFALEIEEADICRNINSVEIEGSLCKDPSYRTTPFGREIADMLIAVNRFFNKSDYIPAIAWGRNARFASMAETGDSLMVSGRLQSRKYEKKLEDGTIEERTAYELSCNTLDMVCYDIDEEAEESTENGDLD